MMNRICLFIFSSLLTAVVSAETVKDITVSGKEPFTDHLSLASDSKDMDVMVKFVFDEAKEALTVSLISYRNLFVFRDDTRYKGVVSRFRHRLKYDKLPYVATADEGQQFRLSYALLRTLPSPRRKYVFHRWIDYDGLIPQPVEYKMVNEVVEQTFDIKNKQDNVVVTLHDIYVMDTDANKAIRFWLVSGKDVAIRYRITLQRDPCFGTDQDLKIARQALADIQKAVTPFFTIFGKGQASSQEQFDFFGKSKKQLLQQFPSRTVDTKCEELQQLWNQYNACVDSLTATTCTLVHPAVKAHADGHASGVQVSFILSRARMIDMAVGQWLLTTDPAERIDIATRCSMLISEADEAIKTQGVVTPEQKKAVALLREAEKYYKTTCRK